MKGENKMTLDEFLNRLRETPREWELHEGRYLTTLFISSHDPANVGWQCPITAVHGKGLGSGNFRLCSRQLGLDTDLAMKIAVTADRDICRRNYDPQLRKQLLEACDLEEVES